MGTRIELKFDNTISRLAGNTYGQEIYSKQVENMVGNERDITIVIPKQIEDIAISFVQGFSAKLLNELSKEEFLKYIKIEANEKIKKKFEKALLF